MSYRVSYFLHNHIKHRRLKKIDYFIVRSDSFVVFYENGALITSEEFPRDTGSCIIFHPIR